MQIILIGLPGSGKTTQGKMLSDQLQIPHISVGDRIREIGRSDCKLGQRLRDYWSRSDDWHPLSDKLMCQVVSQEIIGDAWILEGFPRNIAQARWLRKRYFWKNFNPNLIIFWLDIPEEIARDRVILRSRLGDDIEARLAVERQRFDRLISWFWGDFVFPYRIYVLEKSPTQICSEILSYFEEPENAVSF